MLVELACVFNVVCICLRVLTIVNMCLQYSTVFYSILQYSTVYTVPLFHCVSLLFGFESIRCVPVAFPQGNALEFRPRRRACWPATSILGILNGSNFVERTVKKAARILAFTLTCFQLFSPSTYRQDGGVLHLVPQRRSHRVHNSDLRIVNVKYCLKYLESSGTSSRTP